MPLPLPAEPSTPSPSPSPSQGEGRFSAHSFKPNCIIKIYADTTHPLGELGMGRGVGPARRVADRTSPLTWGCGEFGVGTS